MHQAVAVSDAKSRPEHLWSYSWANPDDEAKMKAQMEDLARKALGLTPPAPAARASAQTDDHCHAQEDSPIPLLLRSGAVAGRAVQGLRAGVWIRSDHGAFGAYGRHGRQGEVCDAGGATGSLRQRAGADEERDRRARTWTTSRACASSMRWMRWPTTAANCSLSCAAQPSANSRFTVCCAGRRTSFLPAAAGIEPPPLK